jgi:hypothetical protein
MDQTLRGFFLGMATVLVLGCGSGAHSGDNYPDAQTLDSGGAGGGGVPDGAAGDGSDGSKPPPMSGGDNISLFLGPATFLAKGQLCTGEVGATGDRWCAFSSPSVTNLGNTDLFVVNVSRAAAGVAIACRGGNGDPNCLRLTGGFFEDTTRAAVFQGDTLVYFDLSGTPYAWRPGMSNGRVLASPATGNVHNCFAARKGTAVLCLRDLPASPADTVVQSDLLAGRLDGISDPPLTKIETVISQDPANAKLRVFQDAFPTPAGDVVAWSSRATLDGPEILKAQTVDAAATRQTVASNVTAWSASPDGARWYWLSQPNALTKAGILQSAPLPAGTAPTTLLADVVDFSVSASGGVAALTAAGALRGFADPVGAPTVITPIDSGVLGILRVSPLGHVAYAKSIDSILGLIDLYASKLDGTGTPCTLTAQKENPIFASFLPGSGAIIWARITNLNIPIGDPLPTTAVLTNLSDCRTTTVASNVRTLGTAGDIGVLFTNDGDMSDATLRVRDVVGGSTLGSATAKLIETRVDRFVSVFPSPGAVVFTVNADSPDDGLYLHLVTSPQAGADGGTTD